MKRSNTAQSINTIRTQSIRTLNTESIRDKMFIALSYSTDHIIRPSEFEEMFTKVFDFGNLTTLDKRSANAQSVIDMAFIAITARDSALEIADIYESSDIPDEADAYYNCAKFAESLAWKLLNMGIHRWLTTTYGWDACTPDSRAKKQRDAYKKYVLSGKIELIYKDGRVVGEKWHGKNKAWSVLKKVI